MNNYLIDLTNFLYNKTENLIIEICKDLNKENEIERLLKKYLKQDTIYKKKAFSIKNKRKKTAYSMFLKYNKIRKENPNMTLEEYNIYKGEYWKNIKSEEKIKYLKLADDWNNQNKKEKENEVININSNQKSKTDEKIVDKDTEIDILDCFFDDEYIKDKEIKNKIEEI